MMPLPSEKTSFWQALSGVCCGTEIFARLIRQKAWRIVLHLFLLLLICSAIVPSIRMMLEREEINQSLMLLQKDFGKLLIYEDGMTPGLRPEESRTVVLGGALPLFYVADGAMPDWKQYREYPVLAVWQAKRLSFVQRLSETDAVLSSFPLGWSAAMLPEPEKVAWENLSAALKTEHEGISAKEPVAVVDIRFRNNAKTYFFDPGDLTLKAGDHVIMDTSRGVEFGYCAGGNHTLGGVVGYYFGCPGGRYEKLDAAVYDFALISDI